MASDPYEQYTRAAVAAVRQAVQDGLVSFPEWLAQVLATAASHDDRGSSALIAGRPSSWEAALVRGLVGGTVGHEDEYLQMFREMPGGPDDPVSGSSGGTVYRR
jgi:hypothetical protein